MQITFDLTQEEYGQLESHIKRAILLNDIGEEALLTATDKILGRLYLATCESTGKTQENPGTRGAAR